MTESVKKRTPRTRPPDPVGKDQADTQQPEIKVQGSMAAYLEKIRRSGKGFIDLPNGDILVKYRDENRRTILVIYSGLDGHTIAAAIE